MAAIPPAPPRQYAIATALLAAMAILIGVSYALSPGWPADLLQASAKAGFVGGIADWFAVTALFRHPMGLPIPHTAILPAQKDRLGRALGRFVADHVFTETEVAEAITGLDLPGLLSRLIADPAVSRPAARGLAQLVPKLLASVEDDHTRRVLVRFLGRVAGGPGAGRVVARALRALMANGRHQQMLSFVLQQLRETLHGQEDGLKTLVENRVREQGGRLIGWAVGASIASRVLTAVNTELDRINPDGSEVREAFDRWIEAEIDRMETDPARAAEIGQAVAQSLSHDVVRGWIWDIWARLRGALEADAAKPEGRLIDMAQTALARLGESLATDQRMRAGIEQTAQAMVRTVLPAAQTRLADFIATVIAGWDTRTLVQRLEQRVGPDLQWVRINGTIVGFLVGGALYAVLKIGFGRAIF